MGSALSERPQWFAAALITVASIVLAHYVQVWAVVPDLAGADERLRRDLRRLDADPLRARRADLRRRGRAARRSSRVALRPATTTSRSRIRLPPPWSPCRSACWAPERRGAHGRCSNWSLMAVSLLAGRPCRALAAIAAVDCRGSRSCSSRSPGSAPDCSSSKASGTASRFSGSALAYAFWRRGPSRRRRLRARVHRGDRQTAARDRHRRLHDRPARLAGRRRRAAGAAVTRGASGSSAPAPTVARLVRDGDRHAEQLADRADAGDERALRIAARPGAGCVPPRGRRRASRPQRSRDGSERSPTGVPISSSRRSALPWPSRCSRRPICSDTT